MVTPRCFRAWWLIGAIAVVGGCQRGDVTAAHEPREPREVETGKGLSGVDQVVVRYRDMGRTGSAGAQVVLKDRVQVAEFVDAAIASGRPMVADPDIYAEPYHLVELWNARRNELIVRVQVSVFDTARDLGPDLIRLMNRHKPKGLAIWDFGTEERAAVARDAQPIPLRIERARRVWIEYSNVGNSPYVDATKVLTDPRDVEPFLSALRASRRRFVPFADPPDVPCHAVEVLSSDLTDPIIIWVPRDAKESEWGAKLLQLMEKHKPRGLRIWGPSK